MSDQDNQGSPSPEEKENKIRRRLALGRFADSQTEGRNSWNGSQGRTAAKQPLLNIPQLTLMMLIAFLGVHLVVTYLLSPQSNYWVFIHLGFIPGRFTGSALFEPLQFVTPLTYMLLHGSWLHLGMNTLMLLAFGSGVEKQVGKKAMMAIFIASGIGGVLAHLFVYPDSIDPVVGASGGLSGLFAAAVILMNRGSVSGRSVGILPFIVLWVGISALFGVMGTPDGMPVAWVAHIGGFFVGLACVRLLKL